MSLTEGITWITMMWNADNGPLSWAGRTISSAMMTRGLSDIAAPDSLVDSVWIDTLDAVAEEGLEHLRGKCQLDEKKPHG